VRRYIVTGAPGAGKTTIVAGLRDRGYAVVGEAATDVIAREQALGRDEPWRDTGFVDAIALVQRERELQPVPPATGVQVFDRSPLCTVALSRYAGLPVTPFLAGEVERILAAATYEPRVFVVHLLGFVEPTAARRISYADSVRFGEIHRQVYEEYGFELVDVPPGPVEDRVDLVERHIRGQRSSAAPTA
jgi:predicted ATPase